MAWIGATPALAKLVPGVNDLATLYPEVAQQAVGWDPSTVTAGSRKKLQWRCDRGHTWEAQVTNRTPPNSSGCPVCGGLQVLFGFNDLASQFPEVAKEANGWDPTLVHAKAKEKKSWCCQKGHTWSAAVYTRTRTKSTNCPYCFGRFALSGVNDLATLFPDLAKQAYGWDPTKVKPNCAKKLLWKCEKGHTWSAFVYTRTPPRRGGCAVCAGHQVLLGVNDLATLCPEVAKEADGWDPTTVTAGSSRKRRWRCEKGHTWEALVTNRTPPTSTGCPFCTNRQLLVGFNDLLSLYPEVALQAEGWDPKKVKAGSEQKLLWRCEKGHTWEAAVYSRTPPNNSGCPDCAVGGFKPGLPAWFYLLQRTGEQQLGVTNEPEVRLRNHSRNGWFEVEVVGPHPGDKVLALEAELKHWLRKEVGLVPGTHENWFTTSLEVRSLADLKARSGVETELF